MNRPSAHRIRVVSPTPHAPIAAAVTPGVSVPARALLALIHAYQRTLSPALPALFGAGCGCRFSPTCSHYAADAVASHGALAGAWLAVRRLARCTPLHPGGFDPVPLPRVRPACHRAA
ncbi:MAG: hypothetical protein RLZZ15_2753 [Verrucomicrobiota bacterium]|jgi:putative membrane protein insertion efficiency factor